MFQFQLFLVLATSLSILAHPVHLHRLAHFKRQSGVPAEFGLLSNGNQEFRNRTDRQLLKTLTDEGQEPPFMFIGCSDSRVSEGTVFDAKPGTLFTQRNIANQFHNTDANAHSVLAYAVSELGVKHVIVMGHYGCGGVAAAIATPPAAQVDAANGVVQNWIEPIREIFQTSTRPEIVELRTRIQGQEVVEEPDVQEPGFRALVEENVKAGVRRIAMDSVITNQFALLTKENAGNNTNTTNEARATEGEGTATDVFIHGWVYDIETGEINDLGISVGPPGKEIPESPFPKIKGAETQAQINLAVNASQPVLNESSGDTAKLKARCESACKAKRGLLGGYY